MPSRSAGVSRPPQEPSPLRPRRQAPTAAGGAGRPREVSGRSRRRGRRAGGGCGGGAGCTRRGGGFVRACFSQSKTLTPNATFFVSMSLKQCLTTSSPEKEKKKWPYLQHLSVSMLWIFIVWQVSSCQRWGPQTKPKAALQRTCKSRQVDACGSRGAVRCKLHQEGLSPECSLPLIIIWEFQVYTVFTTVVFKLLAGVIPGTVTFVSWLLAGWLICWSGVSADGSVGLGLLPGSPAPEVAAESGSECAHLVSVAFYLLTSRGTGWKGCPLETEKWASRWHSRASAGRLGWEAGQLPAQPWPRSSIPLIVSSGWLHLTEGPGRGGNEETEPQRPDWVVPPWPKELRLTSAGTTNAIPGCHFQGE